MEFKGPSFDLSFSPSFAQFSASSKSQERLWHINEGGGTPITVRVESFQTLLWSKLSSCAWFPFVQAG